ncbi:54S ribosomal protein L25 like [Verticillium longisporum]|uniref:Large ribosomal subunit protein mL59 domain-containing protein n=5 Tax=Verticillium TaxID=1036719 RepID=G2X2D6_VERDV|nr:uncharacterized protein VDAG_04460 [Verticillium dahliae VdLs.17]KAF3346162.1 Sulfate permease 2 [Verticillium dahliae VDG2]KAG7124641.1 54S ribosomal protein L25 like [Verticillium longisporum]KAH6700189.1 hypothetical protein EV126DRAFT_400804 [Verticillium dahliae]EGY23022.1 hypothetical protein VDAG_04460 [Verticillium dahliae VdLs.17]KAG7131086.1 54S ribosomal protein L25 like [Verticillium longisporum]
MAASQPYAQLAKALPARLQRFIARYPAPSILPAGATPETFKTGYQEASANPFSRQKHPVTGVWHEPVYSLRRQAELVKLAREHGVEELLPPTVKGSEYQLAHRVEHGLRVKGTGVGQKVKGHQHERMVMPRMERRRNAMLNMPDLMRQWKKVGKYRWKKFPKSVNG